MCLDPYDKVGRIFVSLLLRLLQFEKRVVDRFSCVEVYSMERKKKKKIRLSISLHDNSSNS